MCVHVRVRPISKSLLAVSHGMSARARKPTWCGLTTEEQLQSKQAILHKRAYVRLPGWVCGRTSCMRPQVLRYCLRRRDSLSNFIHAYVAGRRPSLLPSFLLACIAAAGMAAAALSGIDRSSYQEQSLSKCSQVKKRIFHSLFNIQYLIFNISNKSRGFREFSFRGGP